MHLVLVTVNLIEIMKDLRGRSRRGVVMESIGTSTVVVEEQFHVADDSQLTNYLLEVRVSQLELVAVTYDDNRRVEVADLTQHHLSEKEHANPGL